MSGKGKKRTAIKISEVYGDLIEGAPDSIVAVDLKGNITYCNKATEILTGYVKEELIGKHFSQVGWIKRKDIPHYLNLFKALRSGKKIAPFEIEVSHKDGKSHWIEVHVSKIKAKGKIIGFHVNTRDITERRQMEESWKQKILALNSFINNIPDMAWLKDDKSRFIALNKAFGGVAGMKPETLIGQTCEVCFGAKAGKEFRKEDLKVMRGRKQVSIEEKISDSEGNELWLETVKSPIFGESGKVMGTVGIARNVTERKRAEQMQLVLYKIANAINTTKDLNELFKSIQKELGTIVDTTNFYIALYDKATDSISLPYHVDERDKLTTFPAGKTLTSYVIKKDKPLLATEEVKKKLIQAGKVETIGALSKVWLGVPLKTEEEVIGAVAVQSYTNASAYGEKDLEILRFASEQIAIAIQRKRAEEALRKSEGRHRTLIETLTDIVFALDRKGKFTYLGPRFEEITGYPAQDLVGHSFTEVVAPEYIESTVDRFRRGLSGEKIPLYEIELMHKDGQRVPIELNVTSLLDAEGQAIGRIGVARDITERKRAQEALIRGERIATERARLLTDLRNLDRIDDIFTRVCEAVRDSGLFERAVMTLHDQVSQIVHLGQVGLPPDVVKRALQAPPMDQNLRTRITSKKFRISDSFFIPAEAGVDLRKTSRHVPQKRRQSVGGNWQPNDELFVPLRDFSGKIMGYLSVDTPTDGSRPDVKTIQALEMLVEAAAARVREIEAHEALKRERDFSQSILKTANSLIVCLDADANIMAFNQECEKVTGYRREEVLGKRWPELFLPPDHHHFKLKSFAKWVRAHPRDQYEGPIVTKSGEIRTILWSNTAILGSGKKDVIAIAIGQDITERKRAEEALQISQERYELSTKAANVGVWDWDIKTNRFYIDPNVKEILGYKDEEIPNDLEVWMTYVHPDDREPVMAAAQTCLDGKTPEYVIEHRMVHRDGSVRWILSRGDVMRDAKGNAVRMVGTDTDITERKQAEESLKESEEKYKRLVETSKDMIFTVDLKGNFLFTNKALEKNLGYSDEEIKKINGFELVHPDDLKIVAEQFAQLAEGKSVDNMEYRYKTKGGSYINISNNASPIFDSQGNIVTALGIARDITERKRVEEAMRESEQRFRTISTTAKDAILMIDNEGNISYWNPAAQEIFGYSSKEVIGKELHMLLAPKRYHEAYRKGFSKFKKTGQGVAVGKTLEFEAIKKDGIQFPIELSLSAIKIKGKWHAVAILRDITERKKVEESLRLFSHCLDSSGDGIAVGNFEGRITFVNDTFVRMFSYSREELMGKEITSIYAEDQMPKLKDALKVTMEGGWTGELVGKRKDGELFPVEISASKVVDDQGNAIAHMASHRDITERKQAKEALEQSEKKYRTLVETAQEGIGITDPEENLTFVNQAFADMLGYKKGEVLGKNLSQISGEEEFAKFGKETQKRKQGKSSKYEATLLTKKGKPKYFYVSAVPVRAEDGSFAGTLGVLTDITELKRAREQNLLLETSKALSRTLKLDQVLKIATKKIAKVLKADRCAVAFTDQNIESATVKHIYLKDDSSSPDLLDFTISTRDFYEANEFLRTKRYYQIANTRTDPIPQSLRKYFLRAGVKSTLIIPMFIGKRLLGLFNVGSIKELRNFTEEEIGLAQTIVNQVAVAVENSLLLEDIKGKHDQIVRQTKVLERQYQEQRILMEISRALSQTLDLDRIVQIATKETARALQVDRCAISLAFPEEGYAEIRSVYVKGGKSPAHLLGYKLYEHNLPQTKEMFGKRKSISIPNIYHLPDKSFAKEYFVREGIKSALFAPMVHGKKLVGFFTLSTTKDFKTFTKEETKLAQTIADQTAVAIENARLLELVRRSSDDLKKLSSQLLNVQEDERKKLAQELHDEIGQTLFAMKMNLDMTKKNLPPNLDNLEDMNNRLTDTEKLLSETIDRIRSLTTDLRPSMLDDFGLIPALKWYIDNFSKRTNIRIYIGTKNFKGRLSSEIEITLYRIIQEALTNVAKHAQATEVSILLSRRNSIVSLSLQDNGIGFDTKKTIFTKDRLGLFSIKERVELLNGEFKIDSKPNRGTKLNVKIPLTERRV